MVTRKRLSPLVYDCLTVCLARKGPYREHDPAVIDLHGESLRNEVFRLRPPASFTTTPTDRR